MFSYFINYYKSDLNLKSLRKRSNNNSYFLLKSIFVPYKLNYTLYMLAILKPTLFFFYKKQDIFLLVSSATNLIYEPE